MYKALYLSPMIPSYNIRETLNFFKDIFGFTVAREETSYVIMDKDSQTIHLLNAGDIGEMEFYLEVDDLDSLWDSMKEKLAGIKVKEPFDREYGMIPHTKTLMFVGQLLNQ
jgi:catechol 2,3-dioxygenase-like lactoylglutathione lyase family enzyme